VERSRFNHLKLLRITHTVGKKSLYVSGRTASWGAPRCSLSGIAVAGQTYSFSAYAMFADGSDYQNMALKLLYTDSSGQDQYKDIKNASVKKGEWTELSGSFSIPENVSNIILYVEMPGAGTEQCYYVDDVIRQRRTGRNTI